MKQLKFSFPQSEHNFLNSIKKCPNGNIFTKTNSNNHNKNLKSFAHNVEAVPINFGTNLFPSQPTTNQKRHNRDSLSHIVIDQEYLLEPKIKVNEL